MTHDELCREAARWLLSRVRCHLVMVEPVFMTADERPDAIGFHGKSCVVVECKVSKSDLRRDVKKAKFQVGSSMGSERYYFAPKGIATTSDIPDGYGLAEFNGGKVRVVRKSNWWPREGRRIGDEVELLHEMWRRWICGAYKDVMVRPMIRNPLLESFECVGRPLNAVTTEVVP